MLGNVTVKPKKVEIFGAEREVGRVKLLKTNTIDISEIKETFKKEVAIDIIGRKISLTNNEPLSLVVNVKEVKVKYEIKGLEVEVIEGEFPTTVKPQKVNLLLEGPKSIIEMIKEDGSVMATIDAGEMAPGKNSGYVKIDLPQGVKLLYLYPKKVTVLVKKK